MSDLYTCVFRLLDIFVACGDLWCLLIVQQQRLVRVSTDSQGGHLLQIYLDCVVSAVLEGGFSEIFLQLAV